jgi:hypothetical protein
MGKKLVTTTKVNGSVSKQVVADDKAARVLENRAFTDSRVVSVDVEDAKKR